MEIVLSNLRLMPRTQRDAILALRTYAKVLKMTREADILEFCSEYWIKKTFLPSAELINQKFDTSYEEDEAITSDRYLRRLEETLYTYRDKAIRSELLAKAADPEIDVNELTQISRKYADTVCQTPTCLSCMTIRATYDLIKSRPLGLKTFISELDDEIKGMHFESLNSIFGFTGCCKTTLGHSMTYGNSYDLGYKLAYITLEVPKHEVHMNFLSRHSFTLRPDAPLDAADIKKGLLSKT
ncbi:unnamed protein product, partial [marine sediment metagenome]